MKKYISDIFLIGCFVAVCGISGYFILNSQNQVNADLSDLDIKTVEEPTKYDYTIQNHYFEDYPIKPNMFMGDLLMSHGIDFDRILELERKAEDVYSLRKIKAGKKITFIKDDECEKPIGFVYQPGRLNYVKYELGDEVCVSQHDLPYEKCIESATGVVTFSLWQAMVDQGFDDSLVDKLEDALAQVDFDNVPPGDQFKLVYERIYVNGDPVGTGKIYSAAYKSGDYIRYGFYYENEKYQGFYDQEGTPNKKTFLRAPIKLSYRISSKFNPNRFHPILKRRKAHLGTDYAAQRGSPIIAVADGVVTHRAYTKGNGNYIKIRHDNVYQTQYLHMSKFAKNVRPGTRVKQGQVIGYVGSTGLATGPHVCFRFWKNGRQVNHLLENFPPLNPMDDSELPAFFEQRDELKEELNQIPFTDRPVAYAGYAD